MVSALYRVAVCEDEAILCANLCAQCESILDKLKVEHRITHFHLPEKLENALLAGEEFSLLCLDILNGGKSRHETGAGTAAARRENQHPVYHKLYGISQGRLQRPPYPVPAQAGSGG